MAKTQNEAPKVKKLKIFISFSYYNFEDKVPNFDRHL